MLSLNEAVPRSVFPGWDDQSGTTLPAELEQVAIHTPRFLVQAGWGPDTDQLLSLDQAKRMYGDSLVDENDVYFSHQTAGMMVTNARGNRFMMKRMIDYANAKKSRLVLCVEAVLAEFEEYQRDPGTGAVLTDSEGVKLTDAGTIHEGYLFRWTVKTVADNEQWAIPTTSPGTLEGKVGEVSTIYPIMEIEGAHYGRRGNNIGFRFSFPHAASSDPADTSVVDSNQALLYRLQLVERPNALSTASVIVSQFQTRNVDFSFKSGVTNQNTAQTYEIDRVISNYEDKTKGQVRVYAPFSRVKVYTNNLETLLGLVKGTEETATGSAIDDAHLMNIFTALTWDGVDHETVRLSNDSIALTRSTTHYMLDGADGNVSEATLDTLVATELDSNWELPGNEVKDMQKYPFSCMYDTGFSLDTKRKFFNALSMRPDVHVGVCTHVHDTEPNDLEADLSVGSVLLTEAQLTPESTVYGTGVVRAVIAGGVGTWTSSVKGRKMPQLLDLIDKRAAYLGAGNGYMKPTEAYDIYPNNVVSTVIDLTNTYRSDSLKKKFWDSGINYVQSAGRADNFWPAVQTVYNNSTSVLNGDLTMQILCNITKKCDDVWVQTSGDQKNDDAQYFAKQERLLSESTDGRYDGRVTLELDSYKTVNDSIRGFSNTMDVIVYANVMRTVTQFNIISRRRDADTQ